MGHYGARRSAGGPNTASAELLVKGTSVLPNVGTVHFDRTGVDPRHVGPGLRSPPQTRPTRTDRPSCIIHGSLREVMNPMALIMEVKWRNGIVVQPSFVHAKHANYERK